MDRVCLQTVIELSGHAFLVDGITMKRSYVTPPSIFKRDKGHLNKSRFFYVMQGTFEATYGGDGHVTANSKDILYLPSDVEYESRWQTGCQGEYICFEFKLYNSAGQEIVLGQNMFVICRDKTGRYLKTMLEMYEYFTKNNVSSRLHIESLFLSLLSGIVEDDERKNARVDTAAFPIYNGVVYINEHYRSKISVKEVAALCNMSESTFRRNFTRHFGMSPYQYIDRLKLEKARELLKSGAYNVNEVADFLDFYDTSHFNKFFKKNCGMTPGRFLESGA